MAEYRIRALINKAFGFVPYTGLTTVHKVPGVESREGLTTSQREAIKSSALGTPIFMPCKLNDTELPNEPLIEISGSKSIVKTVIDGQDGTFKELFAKNDYVIVIRGVAVTEDGSDEFPEAQISAIRELFEKQKEVRVTCDLLGLFGVEYLVIESCNFPSVEGAQSWQPYQLNCLSDKVFDIELANG